MAAECFGKAYRSVQLVSRGVEGLRRANEMNVFELCHWSLVGERDATEEM